MAKLMADEDDDDEDEDAEEKPPAEESEASADEEESDESENSDSDDDDDDDESESEEDVRIEYAMKRSGGSQLNPVSCCCFQDAPEEDKKKNLEPRVSRHEGMLAALKKSNVLHQANVDRVKDEINNQRELSDQLQHDLDSVLSELG